MLKERIERYVLNNEDVSLPNNFKQLVSYIRPEMKQAFIDTLFKYMEIAHKPRTLTDLGTLDLNIEIIESSKLLTIERNENGQEIITEIEDESIQFSYQRALQLAFMTRDRDDSPFSSKFIDIPSDQSIHTQILSNANIIAGMDMNTINEMAFYGSFILRDTQSETIYTLDQNLTIYNRNSFNEPIVLPRNDLSPYFHNISPDVPNVQMIEQRLQEQLHFRSIKNTNTWIRNIPTNWQSLSLYPEPSFSSVPFTYIDPDLINDDIDELTRKRIEFTNKKKSEAISYKTNYLLNYNQFTKQNIQRIFRSETIVKENLPIRLYRERQHERTLLNNILSDFVHFRRLGFSIILNGRSIDHTLDIIRRNITRNSDKNEQLTHMGLNIRNELINTSKLGPGTGIKRRRDNDNVQIPSGTKRYNTIVYDENDPLIPMIEIINKAIDDSEVRELDKKTLDIDDDSETLIRRAIQEELNRKNQINDDNPLEHITQNGGNNIEKIRMITRVTEQYRTTLFSIYPDISMRVFSRIMILYFYYLNIYSMKILIDGGQRYLINTPEVSYALSNGTIVQYRKPLIKSTEMIMTAYGNETLYSQIYLNIKSIMNEYYLRSDDINTDIEAVKGIVSLVYRSGYIDPNNSTQMIIREGLDPHIGLDADIYVKETIDFLINTEDETHMVDTVDSHKVSELLTGIDDAILTREERDWLRDNIQYKEEIIIVNTYEIPKYTRILLYAMTTGYNNSIRAKKSVFTPIYKEDLNSILMHNPRLRLFFYIEYATPDAKYVHIEPGIALLLHDDEQGLYWIEHKLGIINGDEMNFEYNNLIHQIVYRVLLFTDSLTKGSAEDIIVLSNHKQYTKENLLYWNPDLRKDDGFDFFFNHIIKSPRNSNEVYNEEWSELYLNKEQNRIHIARKNKQ